MSETLFDVEEWDGNFDNLPESIRKVVEAKSKPQLSEEQLESKLNDMLNKREIGSRINQLRASHGGDDFDDRAAKYKKAVLNGGVSMADAEALYFKKPDGERKPGDGVRSGNDVTPDPLSNNRGSSDAGQEAHQWTEQEVKKKQAELSRMPFDRAAKFRRENKEFAQAERKLWG